MKLKQVYSDYTNETKTDKLDLYSRKGIGFQIEGVLSEADKYTVLVEYIDDRIDHSAMTYHSAEAVASTPRSNPIYKLAETKAGYTLCNTGRKRHAAYIIGKPSCLHGQKGDADITLHGISSVVSIKLTAGECSAFIELSRNERVQPHEVNPSFVLNNDMQLISTVGADTTLFEQLPEALERMRDLCPYIRSLGFNGVESYVKWNFVEYEQGVFDWSYYDAVIELAAQYKLGWFPLVIGGSAYALPKWYHDMEGFTGFTCLEHNLPNNIPTIFNDHQTPFVKRYIHEFGKHYEGNKNVFGVRLGPTGNYGESQYPAGGNWGYKGEKEHIHFGWWAADKDASPAYRIWLKKQYGGDINTLNDAWNESHSSFDDIETYHPMACNVKRKRKDFVDWYIFEMSDWCERWGIWMREELKSHDIYQSAGGWGYVECGTDFTEQTRSMIKIDGGIRATNEDESYELNFAITRMMSSAARFYNIPFGSEPAGYGTARSVINRLYNIIINNGQHLFYYHPNFALNDQGDLHWMKYAPLLEQRGKPFIDVAVHYPDTLTKLDDSIIRHLDGSAFFSQVYSLRRRLDFDYCGERMINDGALDTYKVFIFLSRNHDGDVVEKEILDRLDSWVRNGGTLIYPIIRSNAQPGPSTVEDDYTIFNKWYTGGTGSGNVIFIDTLREPLDGYIEDITSVLKELDILNPLTHKMLNIKKTNSVYTSVLENGSIVLYNNSDDYEMVEIEGKSINMKPISIQII